MLYNYRNETGKSKINIINKYAVLELGDYHRCKAAYICLQKCKFTGKNGKAEEKETVDRKRDV